jgi:hypothetical protein
MASWLSVSSHCVPVLGYAVLSHLVCRLLRDSQEEEDIQRVGWDSKKKRVSVETSAMRYCSPLHHRPRCSPCINHHHERCSTCITRALAVAMSARALEPWSLYPHRIWRPHLSTSVRGTICLLCLSPPLHSHTPPPPPPPPPPLLLPSTTTTTTHHRHRHNHHHPPHIT